MFLVFSVVGKKKENKILQISGMDNTPLVIKD